MSLSKIYLSNDTEEIIKFFESQQLLHKQATCQGTLNKPHPPKNCNLVKRNEIDDKFCFRCPKCRTRISIRKSSFFQDLRIPLVKTIKLISHWAFQSRYIDVVF